MIPEAWLFCTCGFPVGDAADAQQRQKKQERCVQSSLWALHVGSAWTPAQNWMCTSTEKRNSFRKSPPGAPSSSPNLQTGKGDIRLRQVDWMQTEENITLFLHPWLRSQSPRQIILPPSHDSRIAFLPPIIRWDLEPVKWISVDTCRLAAAQVTWHGVSTRGL